VLFGDVWKRPGLSPRDRSQPCESRRRSPDARSSSDAAGLPAFADNRFRDRAPPYAALLASGHYGNMRRRRKGDITAAPGNRARDQED